MWFVFTTLFGLGTLQWIGGVVFAIVASILFGTQLDELFDFSRQTLEKLENLDERASRDDLTKWALYGGLQWGAMSGFVFGIIGSSLSFFLILSIERFTGSQGVIIIFGILLALAGGFIGVSIARERPGRMWELVGGALGIIIGGEVGILFGFFIPQLISGLLGGMLVGIVGGVLGKVIGQIRESARFDLDDVAIAIPSNPKPQDSYIMSIIGDLIERITNSLAYFYIKLALFAVGGVIISGAIGGIVGMILGTIIGLFAGSSNSLMYALLAGTLSGFIWVLDIGIIRSSIQLFILRHILNRDGIFPWRYRDFLEHCVELSLLQKAGDKYKFFHHLLKDYFQNMAWSGNRRSSLEDD